ncbi:Membrane alanine aminopeptidase N [hydrothermal vent metagenome]|uniref:Membrane alanine aminopeptidase N n=1 Tax=hydrothermal vent metagenome TaxID=652676 RepID=A0A3B1ASI8_9ZZZZ
MMPHDTPKTIFLTDYQPPEFLIDQVDLHFELGEEVTLVRTRLGMRRNPDAATEAKDLRLHGEQLELVSIKLDDVALSNETYIMDAEGLTLKQVPDSFTLETTARIQPQNNTALEGLYKSSGMFCTQCEAEGFRRITWYLDRPDVMARFRTTIVADRAKYPVLLSNGNQVASENLPDGRHMVSWQDPFPKPCYLFALVAGDLKHVEDHHTTTSGREVALKIYVEPENIDKCDHALVSLKKAMIWDEQNYGREYDLDIYMVVAVNDFNMGAMENKGLNIFNSKYVLARSDTATDQDFQGIEAVIAHEYFHNWTGNRITCRDWFQLSLKEGLTVFRDQEFSADMGSKGVKRIEDVRLLRAHQFAEDAGPMAHPVRPDSYIEINNFYTVTVYEKGAEVVRMQNQLLGSDLYRKGTDLYFKRHDGQAVTTDDFVCCMEDASGLDLGQFRNWYSQAGTPELRISSDYNPTDQSFVLQVSQSCSSTPGQEQKVPYHIPLAVGLLDADGADLALQLEGEISPDPGTRILELHQQEETFCFIGVEQAPVPSLLRGLSAPVKVHYDYSDEELMFLMAHDSDDFNRWDAGQTLSQRIILRMVAGKEDTAASSFIWAVDKALNDGAVDQALLAELLTLPAETYLGDQMEVVDVDGIHAAREGLRSQIGAELKDALLLIYQDCNETAGPYAVEPVDIGRRSLKNRCLGYLMQLDDVGVRSICLQQFQEGRNMTDCVAALSLLANTDCPEREQALGAFYKKWQDDPLVLDKWFAIQATAKLSGTLDRVKALKEHAAFSIKNPNRVRSLIGAFCSGNPKGFHAIDGAGYQFLADSVLELDAINPQVAARMVRLLSRWRRYDATRSQLMQAELQRVLAAAGVSKDVYEIAAKSLG